MHCSTDLFTCIVPKGILTIWMLFLIKQQIYISNFNLCQFATTAFFLEISDNFFRRKKTFFTKRIIKIFLVYNVNYFSSLQNYRVIKYLIHGASVFITITKYHIKNLGAQHSLQHCLQFCGKLLDPIVPTAARCSRWMVSVNGFGKKGGLPQWSAQLCRQSPIGQSQLY